MTTSIPDPSHPLRLSSRLNAAREKRFVGRVRDLDLFREALGASDSPFALLHLHGPGGVGKTALLDAFARLAAECGLLTIRVDGRAIDPSPTGFIQALQLAMGLEEDTDPLTSLNGCVKTVLLLDTYEQMAPLDAWLRETFLPKLPSQTIVVLAGRNRPAPAWRMDPGWGELVHILPLRNLRPEEGEEYLRVRGVPTALHADVLAFTHGHPLALSLVADVLAQGDADGTVARVDDPDVVRSLLERFVASVPSALHRRALQVCAHVRVTTVPLLAEALGVDDSDELFTWLRGLSFIEPGPQGLFPHDLAREVLDADLRWRNPDDYLEQHQRIRDYIVRRLQQAQGRDQQQATFDLLYMHRNNALLRPFLQWTTLGTAYADPAAPSDYAVILETVRRHEGDASAEIAQYWIKHQPDAFVVFRENDNHFLGFMATLRLHDTSPEDHRRDPAIQAARHFAVRHGPVRQREVMLHHRFAMGRDAYQSASAAWDMVVMSTTLLWLTTPRVAWSFQTFADPDYWHPTMSYINVQRSPEADFTVEGRRYGVFTHEWRAQSPINWLDLMARRELDTTMTLQQIECDHPPPMIVLSEPQFHDAVRQALRNYHRPDALATNPLIRSRLIAEHAGEDPNAATLQTLIREAAEALLANRKDERLYRAIYRTYFAPAETQELAAEALGLPFSTYRYHLATGIQRVTDSLWQRELYGTAPA